jgi:hypothetical protein
VDSQTNGFKCSCCGLYHEELPFSYGSDAPIYWYGIPEKEREARAQLTSDLCVMDDQHYFIRGCLELPILDGKGRLFDWNVWVSLSKQSFEKVIETWDAVGREHNDPMFGWLSTRLPYEPDTINLKTMVHIRSVGTRPYIELEPTDHPLALEQKLGLTIKRVQEIAEMILHG